jgi:alginate O-acetyltransferase complex protein AlgI
MLFNSTTYLWFLPLVTLLYYSLNSVRARLWMLFAASCFFYAFFIPKYLLVLFVVIAIDFYAAKKIESASNLKRKKLFLILSLGTNLGILCFFKYVNFFIENANVAGHWMGASQAFTFFQIVLPIGLSFHTFQSMAYVLEVYWGRFPAERDPLTYSIYVLYFPQLVAGPIERPQNILPQLKKFHSFQYDQVVRGLFLIAQGLFKKVVIADTLSLTVNQVYANPAAYGSLATLLALVCFAVQIYCDFSGYSDIARGSSRLLGIELMLNFNKPYLAKSISEFWKRWHISLSTWFRDYLYIPLGGSRKHPNRTLLNLMVVFTVSGFWHGASWTFIIWGALHGFYLICENTFLKRLHFERWPVALSRSYVFLLVLLTWVFFRAKSTPEAFQILGNLGKPIALGMSSIPSYLFTESILFISALAFFEIWDERHPFWIRVRSLNTFPRWITYTCIVLIFLASATITGTQFIYFQF